MIKIFGDDKLPEFSDSDTWMRGYQTTVMISKITNTTTAFIAYKHNRNISSQSPAFFMFYNKKI